MKRVSKIFAVLFIAICTFVIMPNNTSLAAGSTAKDIVAGVDAVTPDAGYATDLQSTVSKLLGFLQVASGLVAVLMIAITGFNYIIGGADVKKEIKDKMLPIVLGLVLVFGAVSVAKFVLGVVGG